MTLVTGAKEKEKIPLLIKNGGENIEMIMDMFWNQPKSFQFAKYKKVYSWRAKNFPFPSFFVKVDKTLDHRQKK